MIVGEQREHRACTRGSW